MVEARALGTQWLNNGLFFKIGVIVFYILYKNSNAMFQEFVV